MHPKKTVVGFYGLGGKTAGSNPRLEAYVEQLGGRMFSQGEIESAYNYVVDNGADNLTIIGYSRGGASAVTLANWLGSAGIHVTTLITFDAHSLTGGSYSLKFDNVGVAQNFYQQNPTTSLFGLIPMGGSNPYVGVPVYSNYIKVNNYNFTGNSSVNHLNIVSEALRYIH